MKFSDRFKDICNERILILDELKVSNLPLILYGAGANSDVAKKILMDYGIDVAGHCTDAGGLSFRPDLLPLEKAAELFPLFNIFVGILDYKAIIDHLESIPSKQINKIYYIDFDEYIPIRGCLSKRYVSENEEKLELVYNLLEDSLSKESYIAFICARLSGNAMYLDKYVSSRDSSGGEKQYFDSKIIKVLPQECFVDCGAYNGDTLRNLFEISDNKEHKVYAFEPDPQNLEALYSYIKSENIRNTTVIPKGAWSDQDVLRFKAASGAGSSVNKDGLSEVNVDSIDNLLKGEPVSFIKMDIEGAEIEALLGAKRIIQKNKPKLAISIYHRSDDLYKIPLLIKQICHEYTLNARLYNYATSEFVLYATIDQ